MSLALSLVLSSALLALGLPGGADEAQPAAGATDAPAPPGLRADARALDEEGQNLYKAGRYVEAEAAFAAATARCAEPNQERIVCKVWLPTNLGDLRMSQGQLAAAIGLYTAALAAQEQDLPDRSSGAPSPLSRRIRVPLQQPHRPRRR